MFALFNIKHTISLVLIYNDKYHLLLKSAIRSTDTVPFIRQVLPTTRRTRLNRQYQSVFTQEDPDTQVPDPDGVPYPDMDGIHVSEDGVRKLLQKRNPRKATGPDMIPARMLKECSEDLASILAIVFNKSIQTGQVPDDWNKANVSAIFKKGQRYDPANYRPVSLTCLCCKILEHIIVSSVMKHVDTHSILTDCQHGFRARRSCETQLVTLTHELASSLDNTIQTDMVVFDFSKAFDRVPHQRLMRMVLEALHTTGYHPSLLIGHRRLWSKGVHLTAFQ